jgi:DNA-binding response OmpR family regulator
MLAGIAPTMLDVGPDAAIDLPGRRLLVAGRPIRLEKLLLDFLILLARRRGQLVTRREALDTIWKAQCTRSPDNSIRAFRKILGSRSIRTVQGEGWVLEV